MYAIKEVATGRVVFITNKKNIALDKLATTPEPDRYQLIKMSIAEIINNSAADAKKMN